MRPDTLAELAVLTGEPVPEQSAVGAVSDHAKKSKVAKVVGSMCGNCSSTGSSVAVSC